MGQDFFHPVFLAEIPFADEHDLQAILRRQSLGILTQGVAQRLSKAGIIENPDLPSLQVGRHTLAITEPWQSSLNQDAVVAGQHARDFVGMSLGQQFHAPSSAWKEGIIENLPSPCNHSTCLVPATPG